MSTNPVDSAIAQASQQMRAGQFSEAIRVLAPFVEQNEVEAIYLSAVCLRKLSRFAQADEALEKVLQLDSMFARAHQERGHAAQAQGNWSLATQHFESAVAVDDALIASWRALEKLYIRLGNNAKVEQTKQAIAQLEYLAPALQAVKSNLNRNRLETADLICREYLQSNKQDIEALRLLAEIGNRSYMLDEAEFILESAVVFQPDHKGARFDYANILLKRQKFGPAREFAEALVNEEPDNSQFKGVYAAALMGVGESSVATEILDELVADKFSLEHTYLLLGHAHKTAGNLDKAVKAYQSLTRFKPDFGDAFWSLANTKTYSFSDQEIAHMEDYRARETTSPVDKVHFNFALGKALEDRQQYDHAFAAYSAGNSLNKEILNYRAPEMRKRVARQKRVCTQSFFEHHGQVGCPAPDPIFIVGLPRAGSTLLEQILASHSQVDGTHELPNILGLSRRLRGRARTPEGEEPRYPKILAELDADLFASFGEQYLKDTQVFRQGAPFFIDKMPNNFLHVGLIKLILPNAKVIDARRHPLACCFSGFKQLFAEGQEFTYGLEDIGDYYKHYVDMMDHWDDVLPGFVLRVQHEDVVTDLETQVRRLLEFCDLEFEPACLEFYNTERNVRTPSSEQVRQPIYTTGLEHWRHFERHLQPLLDALGSDVLARYPIED